MIYFKLNRRFAVALNSLHDKKFVLTFLSKVANIRLFNPKYRRTSIFRARICRIHAKSCVSRKFYLDQKCFLESKNGCGDSFCKTELTEVQTTVGSRYVEVDGTIFYKFKLPAVQINLHFG